MSTQQNVEGYHPTFGYRLIHGEAWYPVWSLEVMDANIHDQISMGLLTDGNLKDALKAFSLKHPGVKVAATTMARHRLIALDGEIVKENQYSDFYHVTDEIEELEQEVFDNMILSDTDGVGNCLTKK